MFRNCTFCLGKVIQEGYLRSVSRDFLYINALNLILHTVFCVGLSAQLHHLSSCIAYALNVGHYCPYISLLTSRPAWVHPQLDKMSQGWILSMRLVIKGLLRQSSQELLPDSCVFLLSAASLKLEPYCSNVVFTLK